MLKKKELGMDMKMNDVLMKNVPSIFQKSSNSRRGVQESKLFDTNKSMFRVGMTF